MVLKLKQALHSARMCLLTSQRFQHFATRYWPARLVARQQASQLFDICSGFVYTQVLSAAIEFDLFERLKSKSKTAAQLSSELGLDPDTTLRLLRATTALKLTESIGLDSNASLPQVERQIYGLGKLGAAVICNPGLTQLMEHHSMFYRDLTNPAELLRDRTVQTQLGHFWSYTKSDDSSALSQHAVQEYSNLMAASQPMVSGQILQAYPIGQHKCLLDLGGGTGQFLKEVARAAPNLKLKLFDLPGVLDNSHLLPEFKITTYSGDFFHDAFPKGADIISVVRILHDHNDDAVQQLLIRIFDALPNNGTLLIAEPLAETQGAERIGDAYFNFYFLAMGKGDPRSFKRLKAMLEHTGFSGIQQHATALPLICSAITAIAKKT